MGNVKAIIFDIGGTLVKTDEALIDAVGIALKENNLELKDRRKIEESFGKSAHLIVKTAVEISNSGSNINEKVNACYKSFKLIFPKKVISHFTLFPNVMENLNLLKHKGVKLAVFTGFKRDEAIFVLEKMKLLKFFNEIVTLDDVKTSRPDPEGILLEISRLGVKKEDCIYVGDAIPDIHMAKNAGVRVVCVKTGVQDNPILEAEKPDFFVEDLDEMIKVLKI